MHALLPLQPRAEISIGVVLAATPTRDMQSSCREAPGAAFKMQPVFNLICVFILRQSQHEQRYPICLRTSALSVADPSTHLLRILAPT